MLANEGREFFPGRRELDTYPPAPAQFGTEELLIASMATLLHRDYIRAPVRILPPKLTNLGAIRQPTQQPRQESQVNPKLRTRRVE